MCKEDFTLRISEIAAANPDSIVLREKDLSQEDYTELAENVMNICEQYKVLFTMHYFYKAAIKLGVKRIHLPLHILRQMSKEEKYFFSDIGVSCHSKEDAEEAEKLGASYITAGHIYDTDCKAGLSGRGLDFLSEVKRSVSIPVYAIGGISADNADKIVSAGADGICIMSGFMKSPDPSRLAAVLREVTKNNE